MKAVVWTPTTLECVLENWYMLVQRSTNPARWRWSVYRLEEERRPRRRGFDRASGYSSSRARAEAAAEASLIQLEKERTEEAR